MANFDFYAVDEDVLNLFNFIYNRTDCRVFESYSAYGQDLKEFMSPEEAQNAYQAGLARSKRGSALLLQLWSPSVSSNVNVKRIALDPQKCNGHTFRFSIEGWGLMQLYLEGLRGNRVSPSHFGHNSIQRAQRCEPTYIDELGPVSEWDWDLLMKTSRKIQYHVRSRMASTKAGPMPVLHGAYQKVAEGYELRPWAA